MMLAGMRQKSNRRGHPPPCFSAAIDLHAWAISRGLEQLWSTYESSGYPRDLRPSVDRLDNAKPYTLDNIRLVTWRENLDAWNRSEQAIENGRRSARLNGFYGEPEGIELEVGEL
jgi:hypothetical protein